MRSVYVGEDRKELHIITGGIKKLAGVALEVNLKNPTFSGVEASQWRVRFPRSEV